MDKNEEQKINIKGAEPRIAIITIIFKETDEHLRVRTILTGENELSEYPRAMAKGYAESVLPTMKIISKQMDMRNLKEEEGQQ